MLCTMPALDRLDAALLGELSREPRVSIVELARRLGVARGTAQARFDRLQTSGVIVGMGPEVDPAAIGYPVIAFTTLDTNQGDLPALVEHLSAIPEVLEAHTISGPGDVLCRIAARSNQHLQEVISRVLAGPTIQPRLDSHRAVDAGAPSHDGPGQRGIAPGSLTLARAPASRDNSL